MSDIDVFRYDGKRAVVVGGATGMGAAVAQTVANLGAEVTVLDYSPVDYAAKEFFQVDLRDPAAIDAAVAQLDGPVHALFNAAGVADGTPGLMKVNFVGHRHIIDSLVADGRLGRGSAVCLISSVAGAGWQSRLPVLGEFLGTPDYAAASAWVDAHPGTDTYAFSKEALNCYVAAQAFPLLQQGIRINAICPGPTDTPLARANADLWLGFADDYRQATGTSHLQPEHMGNVMAFLNSDAASGISGVSLLVDMGHLMSSFTGSFAPGKPLVDFILSGGQ